MLLRRVLCAGTAAAAAATVARADRPTARAEPTRKVSTYLVTGSSSGLGLELTKQLAARGDCVYAACRTPASSFSGTDELSSIPGVVVVPGVDVTSDSCGEVLKAALSGVQLDCVVHNAGGFIAPRAEQKLETISMEAMRAGFELNTLSVLRVAQALAPQLASPGGKHVIISSMIGSISDNGSGGMYAYRTSKAAVNMVSKSMANDLKPNGIAVVAISPGFVATNFGGSGPAQLAKYGAKPVDAAVRGIVEAIDALNLDNTGSFVHTNYGNGLQPAPW